jgi:hypothetical protein
LRAELEALSGLYLGVWVHTILSSIANGACQSVGWMKVSGGDFPLDFCDFVDCTEVALLLLADLKISGIKGKTLGGERKSHWAFSPWQKWHS